MNRYLCMVDTILGPTAFIVSGTDKDDALFVAKQVVERSPKCNALDYRVESIRVIREVRYLKGES